MCTPWWCGWAAPARSRSRRSCTASAALALGGAAVALLGQATGGITVRAFLAVLVVWLTIVTMLELEQHWAEDVNLAFFKINVWVSAAVFVMVMVARLVTGGF